MMKSDQRCEKPRQLIGSDQL